MVQNDVDDHCQAGRVRSIHKRPHLLRTGSGAMQAGAAVPRCDDWQVQQLLGQAGAAPGVSAHGI
jgi:hypothetical protein